MMFDDRRQENFLKPFLAEPLKIDEQKMEHDIETNNVKHEEIKGLDFKPKVYTTSKTLFWHSILIRPFTWCATQHCAF